MGKPKHPVYPPSRESWLVVDDPGCSHRQKFALSCSNSLIPEHLEREGRGWKEVKMEEMGSRREEARKRRRRTTWRYRGVCMKVSTRCDIGLPFRPPEVIARRESILPPPLSRIWPWMLQTRWKSKRRNFWNFFVFLSYEWSEFRFLASISMSNGISSIEKCITDTRDGFVEIYRRFMQIMRSRERTIRIDNETRPRVSRRREFCLSAWKAARRTYACANPFIKIDQSGIQSPIDYSRERSRWYS